MTPINNLQHNFPTPYLDSTAINHENHTHTHTGNSTALATHHSHTEGVCILKNQITVKCSLTNLYLCSKTNYKSAHFAWLQVSGVSSEQHLNHCK